jgi:hypothetical protein
MAGESKKLDDVTVMVCHHLYQNNSFLGLALAHAIIGTALIAVFLMIVYFSRKLQLFLVKERAPLLALVQLITFLMTILVPYVVELLRASGVKWEENGPENIQRKVFKCLYTAARSICYLIFLFRYDLLKQSADYLRELEDLQTEQVQVLASDAQREVVSDRRCWLNR